MLQSLITGNFSGVLPKALTLCDGLIINNTTFGNEGGMTRCRGAVRNNIIWQPGRCDACSPSYCCIQDWTGGGTGNISADPLLVNPSGGDFHLRPGSPCIDRGTSVGAPTTDFEGDPRPQLFGVDIGADETPYNGTIAPTGSITINDGATYTNSINVMLRLSATDDGVVSSMRFSNGEAWTAWENYATTRAWALLTGDGVKTVSVQFRDTAQNVSAPYSDTIRLDTEAPTGTIVINGGAAETRDTTVTLSLSASDAGSSVAAMRLSNDGTAWTAWESYRTSRSWGLSAGDGMKTVYAQFRDTAQNVSAPYSDTIWLHTGPTAARQWWLY